MKQILINDEELETRVALVQDGKLFDYFVERKETRQLNSCVFKGKINNHEASLQAAFVDIGTGKNALLHYWDMLPEKDRQDVEPETQANGNKSEDDANKDARVFSKLKNRLMPRTEENSKGPLPPLSPAEFENISMDNIPELFPPKSDILVQVTKDPIGTKGARLTTHISIPGRYLVLLPFSKLIGVSRKIDQAKEKDRIRKILRKLPLPPHMGIICRTAGAGKKESAFRRDFETLMQAWEEAEETAANTNPPYCVYEEPGLAEKTLRDCLTEDIDEIIADTKERFDTTLNIIKRLSRQERIRVKHHKSATPIFKSYKLEQQIDNIFSRVVPLPSGGFICVDETEALTAIDVNSGKSNQGKDHPQTVLNTNLEAVEEAARQLRLRNIGGILVLDLIDMRNKRDGQKVYNTFKEALANDRARTKVAPISQFGLIEMTRRREHESLRDTFNEPCPYCRGKGIVKSPASLSVEIQRRLQSLMRRKKNISFRVTVHPRVLERLKNQDSKILQAMEKRLGGELSFRADPNLHVEEFHLFDAETGQEF